jgi:Flp pilus assembly pilin Flp
MIKIKRPSFFLPTPFKKGLRRPVQCRGQTLVEYALILAFISVVAISVLINLGQNVKSLYTTIDSQVARAPGGANYSGGP